MSNDI